jgi:glycosyltransferase involved in cell wall biosynthesis
VRQVRVGLPEPLVEPWATWFRSADRVWGNVREHLPGSGVEVVEADPDVLLWDIYRPLPTSAVPLVAVVHEAPGEDQLLAPDLLEHLDRVGAQLGERATRVITCSSASREGIAERYGVARAQIDLAPYGVDASTFRPDGPDAGDVIVEAGGDRRPYILFVGTVLPRKNLPLLRAAMEHLQTHQLVLVASPCLDPQSPQLLEEACAPIGGAGVANLAGIDDRGLAALMRGASALCLPSLSEGFGLPVAEAMACGTPVVVSNRGSLPEVVGDGGVVVPPTVDDVLDGLRTALSDRDELSRRALRRADELTWARTAELMRSSVLEAVRSGSHPAPR